MKAKGDAALRGMGRWFGLAFLGGLLLLCGGCGGDNGSSSSPPPPAKPQALVVGSASGTVLQTIQSQYKLVPGTGNEDSGPYAMIIFDGNYTTPAQLQANPGVKNFLAAGKAVVILNSTEDHRSTGLGDSLWAHTQGSAPATAWIYLRSQGSPGLDRNEILVGQKHLEQIDFPLRLEVSLPGESPTQIIPTDTELQQDSQQWLTDLQEVIAGGAGNIGPSNCGVANVADCSNQTAIGFHDTVPLTLEIPLAINGQDAPDFTAWDPPQDSPFSHVEIDANLEIRGYALLEGDASSGYFHKVIVRQYLNVSPPPAPSNQSWSSAFTHQITPQYPIAGSCDQWTFAWPVFATLGWNDAVTLDSKLQNVPSNSVSIPSFLPQVANNTTTLTTSDSHTETVGVSATAGIQNGKPLGELTGSWSSSWTWGQAKTVSIRDWSVTESKISNDNMEATYTYAATGNSEITDSILRSHALILPLDSNPASNNQLSNVSCDLLYINNDGSQQVMPPNLNGLQTNALQTKSETVWESDGLLPPRPAGLAITDTITIGEVMDLVSGQGPGTPNVIIPCSRGCAGTNGFTAVMTRTLPIGIVLDFSKPALQPPGWDTETQESVPAPWTLNFPPWPEKILLNQPLTGTVTIPKDALDALSAAKKNLLLTYVIATQTQLQTLPAEQVCPGNPSEFNPGNNAVSNGSPPLQIPSDSFKCNSSDQCSAPVPLTFQTSQTNQYDVQVVAWLPSMTLNGDTVLSPQSAWCLDVPETTIQ